MTAIDVDLYVGKRLRFRRRQLGLTQKDVADLLGLKHQQIQKYECGGNRITSRRVVELCKVLSVSPNYFYEGVMLDGQIPANDVDDLMSQKEAIALVRAYYKMDERMRNLFLHTMREFAREEVAASAEEQKPAIQLLKKAG